MKYQQTVAVADAIATAVMGRTAPDIRGITGWLNTPRGVPINLASLRGKVVLVDFWAYSCINSQRAITHVVDWYEKYKSSGFRAIGVHSPEYAFEKFSDNVACGAAGLGITYPIALDNHLSTWSNYRNRYWPAQYLIDTRGIVRHIKFGEGDYKATEKLIRTLLVDAYPGETLPPASAAADTTPQSGLTHETYLSVGKVHNYGGAGSYHQGDATFDYPAVLPDDSFAYRGPWTLDCQGATAGSDNSSIELNYRAKKVYLVAGGNGTMTVTRDGGSTALPIYGPPMLHRIAAGDTTERGHLEVRLTKGLQAFSFTYG
jgi:thiol-disulfide isomerase/thioredoxin